MNQNAFSAIAASSNNRQQTNVAMAIARLGMDNAQGLLLEKTAPKFGKSGQSDSMVRSVWLHTQAISLISRNLAKELVDVDHRLVGMVGMMHDIGKLIIIHYASNHQLDQLRSQISSGMPELQAEWKLLGYTHIDTGMMLALHWKLPRIVHQAIGFHHHPDGLHYDSYLEQIRVCNILIHCAHLLLQQLLPAHRCNHDGVWQANIRQRSDDLVNTLAMIRLDIKSDTMVTRINRELDRLFARFPDIILSQRTE